MPSEPRIHAGITMMLLVAASRAGLSREELLAEAGLDETGLVDADGRLLLSTHRRIGEAIIARAPGQNLAALVAQIATPAAFGVVGKLIQNSRDLRAALTALSRYQQLIMEGSRLGLVTDGLGADGRGADGRGAVLVARVPRFLEELHHPVLAVFAVFLRLGQQLTHSSFAPQRVTFALVARPGDLRSMTPLYGVEPTFGAERHAIHLDEATLALPIVGARPDRAAMFRAHADSLMVDLDLTSGVAADVCRVLVTALPDGVTRQDRIAKQLGMSARTLSRRLKAQGTSFGVLLDRVRQELSQHYLRDNSLSVHEVSFLLGYSEPSTFFRAFKKWTGRTPRAWRSAH